MTQRAKITTGANDRPRNETIGQSGGGLPDDTGKPVDVGDAERARVREKVEGAADRTNAPDQRTGSSNPDAVPAGTPGAAENICRRCSGTGKADGGVCSDCGGSGKVLTPVGGGG